MRYIIGNWKMNGNQALLEQFGQQLSEDSLQTKDVYIGLAPPMPYLATARHALPYKSIHLGAQTVSGHTSGAFTGQVSAHMLHDIGAQFSLIGHSERRIFESVADTQAQIEQCFSYQLRPILCIGESLEDYQTKRTQIALSEQLAPLNKLATPNKQPWLIAYEPKWAIGSGLTPSEEEIKLVIDWLKKQHTCDVLYGGSVSIKNLESILATGANGALIGGASLDVEQFVNMVKICIHYS